MTTPRSTTWCVIGAGPSGLTALKNLRACGIEAECLDREEGLGGNWRFGAASSRIFSSTRLISSKSLTAYTDFPMPRHWPAYPSHALCLEYLERYAERFGLLPHIRPRSVVERVEPATEGGWSVRLADGRQRHYTGVVIAAGHNHEPRFPDIPGRFSGPFLHAADYKSPTQPVDLAGRRVLVIGGGNSACDIAVDASGQAARTVLSLRRGYYVVPRFIMGRPADLRSERLLKLGLPLWLRRMLSLRAIAREIGLPWRHGLPRPDHKLWESHPIVNGDLCRLVARGRIVPAGPVARFEGDTAIFTDGRRETFDVVICASGYRITHPFIDGVHLAAAEDGCPRLFLNLLHPDRDDIAAVGLIQPDSGQWGLTDLQSQLVARMAVAARHSPKASAWLYRVRRRPPVPGPIRYVDSPRHRLEVEHFSYAQTLRRLVAALDRRLRASGSVPGSA
ncbi:MAG: putative oxidoreductase CzcO [Planctomycetota bacterium]